MMGIGPICLQQHDIMIQLSIKHAGFPWLALPASIDSRKANSESGYSAGRVVDCNRAVVLPFDDKKRPRAWWHEGGFPVSCRVRAA
jgi:hypothetical protein